MKRKISLSTTVTLVLLTMALTVSLTMLLAMRYFNSQLQLVSQRQAMYSHINDVDKIVREYYPNLSEEQLRQSIARGYVAGVDDAYAAYYSPEQYQAEQLKTSGKSGDVGVVFSLNNESQVVISSVYADSAADKAGVKVGDVVTAIDSVSVEGKSLAALQDQVRTASKMLLTVRRGEGSHAYELSAFEYTVRSVQDTVIGTIGYVKVTAFYDNTPAQFEAIVSSLKEQGVTGLVFDLRNNAGGSPAAVQEMLSYVMPLGAYGTMTDTKGNVTKLTTKVSNQLDVPVVTLINGATAGEAEFFAGVLQESGFSSVLGQTSAGKAKYQSYFVLEQDYSALKLTVGEYGLMKSGSWQGRGIVPDQEVALPPEQESVQQLLDPREDMQVQAAVDKLEEAADLPMGGTTDPEDNFLGGDTGSTEDPDTTTDGSDAEGDTTATAADGE